MLYPYQIKHEDVINTLLFMTSLLVNAEFYLQSKL